MINRNIVRYTDCGEKENVYGIGNRLVIDCNGNEKTSQAEVLLAELLGRVAETGINKITFIEPLGQAQEFSYIIQSLKEANKRINICVYSEKTIDEIYSDKDEYEMDILKYIDTLIDGKFDESLKSNLIWFRKSTNQRVIDMKATNYFNDGFLYLTGQVHLQEPYNTRYQFCTWLKAVNEKFIYNGRLKDPGDWRAKECIKYICRFDPSMRITNNINEMVEYMRSLGTGRKMTCKFRYLHNRWCHRVILKQKIKSVDKEWDIDDSVYDNMPILHYDKKPKYETANELLDFFKMYRKWEISVEKRRNNIQQPVVIHNYEKEEVQRRHLTAAKKAKIERDIKKANKKQRTLPKKPDGLKGIESRMYKSSKACKIINNRRAKDKKEEILKLLNK